MRPRGPRWWRRQAVWSLIPRLLSDSGSVAGQVTGPRHPSLPAADPVAVTTRKTLPPLSLQNEDRIKENFCTILSSITQLFNELKGCCTKIIHPDI